MIYAGIGSRRTPFDILKRMENFATRAALKGLTLRSGGAVGADGAFEYGARRVHNSKVEIYRPERSTHEANELSSRFHPNWKNLTPYVKNLMGRNAQIILGPNLDSPVDFVICWTPGGALTGGTAQGIKIAQHYKIPVWNVHGPKPSNFPI